METEVKVLTPKDPEFLPVQFDLTDAQMNQLAVDYDPSLIPKALEVGDENYTFIHNKVMAIVKVRTGADKIRKTLKADSLAWGKKVDGYAKGITDQLLALEAPWRQVKLDLEEAERRASEIKLAAEQKRQAEIEGRVAGIRAMSEGLINADAVTIQKRIDAIDHMVITDQLFSEYQEAAKLTGDIVRKSLVVALDERLEFEGQQAVLAEQKADMEVQQAAQREAAAELQAQMDAQQAAIDAQKKEMADAQAVIKASEDAAKAAEAKEAQRKADVKEAAQRSADKAQADKKNAAKMLARLPQDKEVAEYVSKFTELLGEAPQITDAFLIGAVMGFQKDVTNSASALLDLTQGAE